MKCHLFTALVLSAMLVACESTPTDSTPVAKSTIEHQAENVSNTSSSVETSSELANVPATIAPKVEGWLRWRGPDQFGVSHETNLPDNVEGKTLWETDLRSRGTAVINGDKMYYIGYEGERADLQEVVRCVNANTGSTIWEHRFNDYISDVIYDRYAIGAPTIDPDTGNVFVLTTPGTFVCFSPDGKQLWQHSMTEKYGRLTFPNGRTGAPAIDGDLVVVHSITSNWGAEGPVRDRLYAFDKYTGELVWSSSPGVGPPYLKDSSFSTPVFAWANGKRVLYVGLGCGNVACVNAKTGDPIWRYQLSIGGVNSSILLYKDMVIAIHGKENIDSSKVGRMVALKTGAEPKPGDEAPLVLDKSHEVWRNDDVAMFTSSPVLVGNRVYQVSHTGELHCINADTGAELWHKKLGPSQIHASPAYADGKLYIPMNDGEFYIIKPTDQGPEVLSKIQLKGNCLGAPAIYNGKIAVFSTERLYCFGSTDNSENLPKKTEKLGPRIELGQPVGLQVIPTEVLLKPAAKQNFRVFQIDENGHRIAQIPSKDVKWEKFIPPTAKVKAEMDAEFNADGVLVAKEDAKASAGAYRASYKSIAGVIRGRILTDLPFAEDFEDYELDVPHSTDGVNFAYPPLPWIGARFKWEVRERDGTKALAKTLDRLILQRATTFVGPDELNNYTIQADVMTDGNRRLMSEVGLVNQRYIVVLKGNHQLLEVNSNHERIKESVKFPWSAKKWYTLKVRVDVADDGSGFVRAKAWEKGQPEPEAWTIEVKHNHAHKHGAPGFFGFSPQSKHRVYIDNLKITPNK